jgi:hypothetical protein
VDGCGKSVVVYVGVFGVEGVDGGVGGGDDELVLNPGFLGGFHSLGDGVDDLFKVIAFIAGLFKDVEGAVEGSLGVVGVGVDGSS